MGRFEDMAMTDLPPPPQQNEILEPGGRSDEALKLLALRRSCVARDLCEPGPTASELDELIRIAARVPDHGKLGPWRFFIFEGQARYRFGLEIAHIFQKKNSAASEDRVLFERNRLMRAPTVVCITSNVAPEQKPPVWEQQLSAGAACQTMLIAATAMGYGAQWLTEWYSYDRDVDRVLRLGDNERVAGFLYLGTAPGESKERQRAKWEDRVVRF